MTRQEALDRAAPVDNDLLRWAQVIPHTLPCDLLDRSARPFPLMISCRTTEGDEYIGRRGEQGRPVESYSAADLAKMDRMSWQPAIWLQ